MEQHRCGLVKIEGQMLYSSLRRGWYWGNEEFKADLDELGAKLASLTE